MDPKESDNARWPLMAKVKVKYLVQYSKRITFALPRVPHTLGFREYTVADEAPPTLCHVTATLVTAFPQANSIEGG